MAELTGTSTEVVATSAVVDVLELDEEDEDADEPELVDMKEVLEKKCHSHCTQKWAKYLECVLINISELS